MVRRYLEPVTVRTRAPGAAPGQSAGQYAGRSAGRSAGRPAGQDSADGYAGCLPAEPVAFVWRGRRYAVRTVLAHWRERRAWWRDVLDPARAEQGHAPAGARIAAAARERHVWRVEAEVGRGAPAGAVPPAQRGVGGVFELACDDADPPLWWVLRVAD